MKNVTKIVMFALCAVLAMDSCTKRHLQHEDDTQSMPVDFSAVSQYVSVKADDPQPAPLSDYHQDFGVWGIARQAGNPNPYILWMTNLEQVTKQGDYYKPANSANQAFWLKDYTYHFLAIAPFTGLGANVTATQATASAQDKLTFTYDLGTKYEAGNLDFDLMGAAAVTPVTTTKPEHQSLVFWHLFSKICIKVNFVNATGTVDEIRLSNVVTKGDYVLSLDEVNDFDKPLSVTCTPSIDAADKLSSSSALVLNSTNKDSGTTQQWTLHVIPQVVSGFDMYIDFTIGASLVENFKVNLSAAGTAPYTYNGSYNWNLNITPNGITFEVAIVPWSDDNTGDNDFDFE